MNEMLTIGKYAGGKRGRFELPADVQTTTLAVLGIRGSGKTNTATVMVEELAARGRQVVVIDPTDVWWGLRSSADGKRPGHAIVVCGGSHGQVPLAAGDGATLADFVVQERCSLVLSLRHLRKGDQKRLVTDFAEQLYHRKGEAAHRTPLLVVIDEADAFVPQRVGGAEARMVGAIEDLVRRGRSAGLGVVLISQRAASVNKDVLTQIELLVAHRHTSPQDRKALDAWVEAHDTAGRRDEFMRQLAGLPVGTAWVWSPGWLDVFARVEVRARQTFDSSATPKGGQAETPKAAAAVDIEVLRTRLAATIQEAEARNPRKLLARIAELERELSARTPELDPDEIERIVEARVAVAVAQVKEVMGFAASKVGSICRLADEARTILADPKWTAPARSTRMPVKPPPPARTPRPIRPADAHDENGVIRGGGAKRMLEVLVSRHPARFTEAQWATLSGLKRTGGTWATYKSRLVTAGLVERSGDLWTATDEAIRQYGNLRRRMDPAEILADWKRKLGRGPGRMIDALLERGSRGMTRDELAAAVELEATGGTFATYLSRLRSNGLVETRNADLQLTEVMTSCNTVLGRILMTERR